MMNFLVSYGKIKAFALLLLLLLLLALPGRGSCMTRTETSQYIQIPITQWMTLTNELRASSDELTAFRAELTRLKKPSAELLSQLETAEKMLLRLQMELQEQKKDLMLLSKDRDTLKTSLATLKERIDKERRVHKRQVWQNRFWCLLFGAGIGLAASR